MPKVKRNTTVPQKRRRRREPAVIVDDQGEEVRVSSVLFGIVMLVAIVVATAAWMGGSLSQFESKFANFMDDSARSMGVSVNNVSVLGLEQDPGLANDVRAAAMIEPGENMFRANPHLIQRRVEATRKVLNVRVHRLWPDQVVIIADAAEPVALWHDGKVWTVVDGLGRIIPGARPEDHKSLVRLAGYGAPEAAPELVAALQETPDLTKKIAIATRVANRRWDLRVVSGASVRLPEDSDMPRALTRLAGLERRAGISQRPLDMIDLRSGGRVYLSPTPGTTPARTKPARQS